MAWSSRRCKMSLPLVLAHAAAAAVTFSTRNSADSLSFVQVYASIRKTQAGITQEPTVVQSFGENSNASLLANELLQANVCERYLKDASCTWTATTPCAGQPRGPNFTMNALADGSDGFMCCCEQELWKQNEIAVADTCGTYFEATQCNWTDDLPCEEQYRSSEHSAHAQPDGSEGYTCCCELGYWKKAVEQRFEHFKESTSLSATCDAYLDAKGCAWTDSTPCKGQNRTSNFTQDAFDDGSLYYKCCCELDMYLTHGADAKLPYERDGTPQCDSYLIEEGCSWTARYPCAGQPHGNQFIQEAGNDGFNGYKCCCEQEYWKKDHSWLETAWKPGAKELMYVHIPTNARTLVEDVSSIHRIWWPQKWRSFWKTLDMPDGSSCQKSNVPPQYLRSLGEPDWDVAPFKVPGTFCVTQNPYERAVSEYLYSLSTPWGPSMSSIYHTDLLKEERCTAYGLNNFLQAALQRVQEGGKFLHDCHFVPQNEFVLGTDGRRWCNNILRVETFPGSFNELMAKHEYGPRMLEESVKNAAVCGDNVTSALLWDKTRLMIDTIYHDDFVLLNYTKTPL